MASAFTWIGVISFFLSAESLDSLDRDFDPDPWFYPGPLLWLILK